MAYSIIIVDDEKEISSGFSQFFPWGKLGYEVSGTFSGAKEALTFLRDNPVDVIVSDVIMPGMTGIDFARELSEMEPESGALLLLFSAYGEFKYAQQALKYGCTEYILKSTNYEDLIGVFDKLRKKLDARRSAQSPTVQNSDKVISIIREYIHMNPGEATLEGAAKLVYMSPSYVSRYYKQKTGLNFMEYVMEHRMRQAAELLLDLRYKIFEISSMLGYTNPFNFTRSFKKYYNMTPRDYRFQKLGRILPGDEESLL